MSDLTELYKFYGEKFPGALKTGQEAQASAIALDNARRAQQEREGLKALYAQQAQPSYQQIGAIDPALAQEYLKNQFAMQKDMVGMQYQQAETGKILGEVNKDQAKIRAQATVPIVDRYNEMIASGMPKDQALQWFHSASGQALSKLQQQNLIPSGFPSYDPNSISPEMVENAAAGLGFPSQKIQAALKSSQTTAEQQARVGAGPVMTPEQAYGGMEAVPGAPGMYVTQPPLGGQTAPQMQMPDEMTAQLNLINSLMDTVKEPSARAALIEKRNNLLNTLPPEQGAIATPEQAAELQIEGAAKKEAAVSTAKQQAEEQQTINKSLNSFETLPDINHIRDLVKGSIGSDIEYWTNRFGQTIGESLASGDIQSALAVVANDMANTVPFAPGSQSDKELAQRLKQVGNLESDMTIDQKMTAFEEWFKKEQRYIGKYGKYSDAELLDLGREGKITHETALKVRANRNKGQ
jgi:hypothetical protein